MIDIYEELAKIRAQGAEAALVTIISASGSTPREAGVKMLVRPDGSIVGTIGGGGMETLTIKRALEAIKSGEHQRFCYSLKEGGEPGMICGGDVDIFIEPILPVPVLYIFGGGHIALTLANISKLVGFKVIVIDNRPEFANPERFPNVDLTIVEDFAKAFRKIKVDKSSYIVIITYGHKGDEIVLEKAVATKAKYIGMIGSRKKNQTIFSHLLAKGISQERLDNVHAPIGIDIFAQTPEEIAVSILAEMIKVRRSPRNKSSKANNG